MLSPVRDNSFFRMEFLWYCIESGFYQQVCFVKDLFSNSKRVFHEPRSLVFPRKHRRARLGRSHPRILPIFPCADSLCMSYPTTNTFNPDSIPIQSRQIFPLTCRVTRYLVLTALMFCVREGILDEESRPLPCADPKQLHFRGDIE